MIFDITLEHGRIKVQCTGQPACPGLASAEDELDYTVADARLSFEHGADGRVDAPVLHEAGAETAKRLA